MADNKINDYHIPTKKMEKIQLEPIKPPTRRRRTIMYDYDKPETELLRDFLKTVQKQLPVPESDSDWPPELKVAILYIHQYIFHKDLTVSKLREVLYGCNGNDFSTNFSYYIGTPPSVYINDLRIETAKRILSEKRFSNANIMTIAKVLGFSGKGNFFHAFRAREEVSPGKFRKRRMYGKSEK